MSKSFSSVTAKRNIRCLQFIEISNFGYLFAIPVMVDYIASHMGSFDSYFYLVSAGYCTVVLFAIYLGALSDLKNRRFFMIAGLALKLISWLLFILFAV